LKRRTGEERIGLDLPKSIGITTEKHHPVRPKGFPTRKNGGNKGKPARVSLRADLLRKYTKRGQMGAGEES